MARDHTGVQAGVKAGVNAQLPGFHWSKCAVHFRGGRDAPRIALEQHRSHQMTKECFKMHFARNLLLTFRNLQVAKHSDCFCSTLGIKWILRQPLAPYAPAAPADRSAPYAPAARTLRSRRSLPTLPPLASYYPADRSAPYTSQHPLIQFIQ